MLMLDACCAINLLASGMFAEVAHAQGIPVAVADLVLEREVLRIPGGGSDEAGGDVADERTLTLQPLVDAGAIEVMSVEGEEIETFVSLALRLDDGEAMSAALAIHRRGALATDDRKAIRVLGAVAPDLEVRRTSDLVRRWIEMADPPDARVREVLRRIERDASFTPPAADPNATWWRRRA
jgi:hypothetical protein